MAGRGSSAGPGTVMKVPQTQRVRAAPSSRNTQKKRTGNCIECGAPPSMIEQQDGKRVCTACGKLAGPGAIISDVQFSENAAGAATLQGSHVGQDQARAKTFSGHRNRAIDGLSSTEQSQERGKREIGKLRAALGISQPVADQAFQHYKLAHIYNFTRGRRLDVVAAACLAAAVRRQERSSGMLIDFSEKIGVSVFKLGEVLKDLIKEVNVGDDKILLLQVPPENLVYRFAHKLDFGELTEKVANDTVRLIRRMNYDWITEGRRPSGVCGACLILAARMNNFRRTTREVMFVAKISDTTIQERLNEFKHTQSSKMTVDELRAAPSNQNVGQYPPALYRKFRKQVTKHEKLKRSRKGKHQSEMTEEELQDLMEYGSEVDEEDSEPEEEVELANTKRPRRSARNKKAGKPDFPSDSANIPVDPQLLGNSGSLPIPDRSDAETAQRLLQLRSITDAEAPVNTIVRRGNPEVSSDDNAPRPNTRSQAKHVAPVDRSEVSPSQPNIIPELNNASLPDRAEADAQLRHDVEKEWQQIKGRKRDRRLKEQPVVPSKDELLLEREVEAMIEAHLADPALQIAFEEIQATADIVRNQLRGDEGKEAYAEYHDQAAVRAKQMSNHRRATSSTFQPRPPHDVEDPLREDEFDDDPEIANVLLNDQERHLKETIWTHANRDHLRQEIERKHRAELRAAQPARKPGGGTGAGKRKRAPRIGEGQACEFDTAAEAAADMLDRRGGQELSRKLNYESYEQMKEGLKSVFSADPALIEAAKRKPPTDWREYGNSDVEAESAPARRLDRREASVASSGLGNQPLLDDGEVEELGAEVDEETRQRAAEEFEHPDDDDEELERADDEDFENEG